MIDREMKNRINILGVFITGTFIFYGGIQSGLRGFHDVSILQHLCPQVDTADLLRYTSEGLIEPDKARVFERATEYWQQNRPTPVPTRGPDFQFNHV